MSEQSLVNVDYHAFLISAQAADPTNTYTQGSVFDAGDELLSIHTGIAYGPVNVTIEHYEQPPFLNEGASMNSNDWDNIEEVTVKCRQSMRVITLHGEVVPELAELPATHTGTRAFRVATRGRAANWDRVVDEPTENYLIQTWPSGGPSIIQAIQHKDGIWPTSPSDAESSAAYVDNDGAGRAHHVSAGPADVSDGTVAATGGPVRWKPGMT